MRSKREVILLSLVGISAVLFILDSVVSSKKSKSAASDEEQGVALAFVAEQMRELSGMQLAPYQRSVLDMLQNELPQNPFARQWVLAIANRRNTRAASGSVLSLSYDGYIRARDRYIALVNEEGYEVGDRIESEPFNILAITAEQIGVGNSDTQSPSAITVNITPSENDDE